MTTVAAEWDVGPTKTFIDLCIEQIYKKERLGSSFSKDGWKYIVTGFQEKTCLPYTKKQLKNRYDSLRREWRVWEKLFLKETGISIDHARNMVIAEDEWWKRKIKENKEYRKYRYKGETVSRLFHRVLKACFRLSTENIKPLDPEFRQCHQKIATDARYHPYFKDCIGAIDGTHIKCVVSQSKQDKYIGRKGYPTQNIMAVCDWDMCFTFVLAGWEGTAHDARVFREAIETTAMNFPHPPEGKYYLVDAGYPTPDGYIGPYKRERYHLPKFRRQSGFRNPNEYFNFYHSSLRCTIERTFGVWKNRFHILQDMPSYKFRTQVRIVCATMAIHNFIRRHSQNDVEFDQVEEGNMDDEDNVDPVDEASSSLSSTRMNRLRDDI